MSEPLAPSKPFEWIEAVRGVERFVRRFAIVALLFILESDRALLLVIGTAIFGMIGYASARYAGRRRVELLSRDRTRTGWKFHVREHVIGWAIFLLAFLWFARQSTLVGALVLFVLWSLGFMVGDVVHHRTPEGRREQRLRQWPRDAADLAALRETVTEERSRVVEGERSYHTYEEYLCDRAAPLLTREEFFSAKRDRSFRETQRS